MYKKDKEIKRVKVTPPQKANRGLTLTFITTLISPKKLPYVFGFCLITVFLLNPYLGVSTKDYELGQLIDRDIKAPFSMAVVDKDSTEKEKLAAENSVLPVYDYDNYEALEFEESSYYKKIREAFSLMREKYRKAGASGDIKVEMSHYELSLLKKEFETKLGVEVNEKTFAFLSESGFSPKIERILFVLLKNIIKQKIISKNDLESIDLERGIVLNFLKGKSDKLVFKEFDAVITLEDAFDMIQKSIEEIPNFNKNTQKYFLSFFEKILQPTITFNRQKTEEAIGEARESVKPVVINIKKGEMIIRDGTFISKRELMILKEIRDKSVKKYSISYFLAAFTLIFFAYLTICSFSSRFIKKFNAGDKELLIMGISILLLLVAFRFFSTIIPNISSESSTLPIGGWQYLFPFALGAMLIRLLFNSETSIIYAFFLSILFGIFAERSLFFMIFVFFTSIIAAGMSGYGQDRGVLLKAGLKTGCYNIVLVLVISFLNPSSENINVSDLSIAALSAFAGGIISALLTWAIIPLLEWILDYTTDIRLLELANLNQPLLRELMVQCPGTYHHSIIVGNLVEAAAEGIQANSLFAKVAAYYHDIGKLRKPQYFIENQGEENKHDKLTPSMSALILISHIKDGVELAEEYSLGKGIRDIIEQHQGTTLIKFFFHKAKEQAEKEVGLVVEEKDFRYPGPKPQTKEAALVMIADHVEATVRSIQDPGASRIKTVIQSTIDNLFADGQFDECDLTLRDLNNIAEIFTRVVTSMHHHRIDYPSATKGIDKNETIDKTKDESSGNKTKEPKVTSINNFGGSSNT